MRATRELVLNQVSCKSPDRYTAVDWLKDLTVGMAQLVNKGIAGRSLRSSLPVSEISCSDGYTLFDAIQDLRSAGARDSFVFLMRMSSKCPLMNEVGYNTQNRFLACESIDVPTTDGEPLVLCAITDWISVSFPSNETWASDQFVVSFNELLPNETYEVVSETIDNISQSEHATSIYDRHHSLILEVLDPMELWERRETVFPNLIFGPDVVVPLENVRPTVRRLSELNKSAEEWRCLSSASPRWACKVTPESESVRKNTKLFEHRRFRSTNGKRELFEWHARVGNGIRIHLRFDANSREVEVGYIGQHLPL